MQLLSHALVEPEIRLNALESIEGLLGEKIIETPALLLEIDKAALISQLAKQKKLNDAELSIINHIYDLINGRQISFRVKKLSGIIDLPKDFDFKRDYTNYLRQKYK